MRRRIQSFIFLGAVTASLAMPCEANAVPYDVIASSPGGWPIQGAPTLKIIRSQEELADLWRASGRSRSFLPEVDFRRQTVIGYFLSLRPSSGYRLAVEGIDVRAGTMTVQLIETTPGPCCVVLLTGGAPNILIATIPWHGPVDVQVRREAAPACPGCSP
jgi:hypothetical protein